MAETIGQDSGEQLGICLELLLQKLSGDITPTEISGGSTLTEFEEEATCSVKTKEIKVGTEDKDDANEKAIPDKTITEIEMLLKALGLTNNNVINL